MLQRRSWKESRGNDSKRRQRTVKLQEVTRMCRVDGLKSKWYTHSLLAQVSVVALQLSCCSELHVEGWPEGGWRLQTPHPPVRVSSSASWSSSRKGAGKRS